MKPEQIVYHRNGVGGEGFYAVTFRDGRQNMVAVVFDGPGQVAVFDRDKLGASNVIFGQNSWRGDHYEGTLRVWIKDYRRGNESPAADPVVALDF